MTERETILNKLINDYDYTDKELKGKRVKYLKSLLDEQTKKQEDFEDTAKAILEIGLSEDVDLRQNDPNNVVDYDLYNDPDWTDKAMKLLRKDEKVGDKPRCTGLRRLACVVFGPISTEIKVEQVPDLNNKNKSAVSVTISTRSGITVGAVAEAHYFNTEKPYSDFPLATAETRAEGRALKKLLNLNVMSFEEVELTGGTTDVISPAMLNAIRAASKKNDIDLNQLLAKEFPEVESVELLSQSQAAVIIAKIREIKEG